MIRRPTQQQYLKAAKWSGAGLVLILAVAAIWLWDPLPKNLSAEALSARASAYDVEIIRDNYGVPHIYGSRDADVAFGVAYAHAEDDFSTIQETIAATRGVLARYRGAKAAPTDYLVALMDIWPNVDAKYDSDLPDDVKDIAEAYAAGLNLYAAENPESTWQGLTPFTGRDVIAGFAFKTPFFYGFDETVLALFDDERTAQLSLDPVTGQEAWLVGPKAEPARGSNAIAVAPERATDWATRLLINSHQPMTGPVAWWEAHLVSEEGLNIQGGLFPGTPVIIHGFNRDVAWANTVNKPDLVDVYRLTLNPRNKSQYRLDGEWRELSIRYVTIRIKLFGPFAYKARRKIERSEHGPVIKSKHGDYAVRYAGMGEVRQLEQYYRLNKTTNWRSFQDAMSLNALPSINYVYADRRGNIGFIHNGQYPNRREDWNWQNDLPGDRLDLIWQGYRPYSDVPFIYNPPSGFIYNANNQPFRATDGSGNLRARRLPADLGLQTNDTNRSLRILELARELEKISRDDLLAIKFDTAYTEGSVAHEMVGMVLQNAWINEPEMKVAAEHLAAWDFRMDAESRHAALGGLTVMREIMAEYKGERGPDPLDAFREAVAYLEKHHGRIDPEWGEVNRLIRGGVNLPLSGGPDTLRAIYPAEIGKDGLLRASAGDTWIALVEWDRRGNQSAKVVHQFGAATKDTTSLHYDDQAPLFATEQWRDALIEREDVEAAATRRYRPGRDE